MGARRGKGGALVPSLEASSVPFWHKTSSSLRMSISNRFPNNPSPPLISPATGWNEDDLPARRKGHRAKLIVARRLRQEKKMSLEWVAHRLHKGSWTSDPYLVNEQPPAHPQAQEAPPLCQ